MKRVLVTGASGFIGRATLAPLAARGFEVHAVSSRPRSTADATIWHTHDLLLPGEVSRVVQTVLPTHLLHLAWYAVPGKYWIAPENVDWMAASVSLARAFAQSGGERFVGAGTCAEYAPTAGDCDERSTPIAPSTLYGTCKRATHDVVAAFAAGRLSAAWGRIFFLYGPYEPEGRLVPDVIRALLEGREALCTAGTQVRDFMHVEDVGAAFAALVDSSVDGPVNIASGFPASVADVVNTIARQLDGASLVRLGARPMPTGEIPSITAATTRLREDVGWAHARPLDVGIADAIAWWRQRR